MRRLTLTLATATLLLAGCTHTTITRTTSVIGTYRLPEAAPVAQLDTLDEKAAGEFRAGHSSAGQCVFRGVISEMFWKDDQKLDRLLLQAQSGTGYQLFKVEIVGEKTIRHVEEVRNGKASSSTKILN